MQLLITLSQLFLIVYGIIPFPSENHNTLYEWESK